MLLKRSRNAPLHISLNLEKRETEEAFFTNDSPLRQAYDLVFAQFHRWSTIEISVYYNETLAIILRTFGDSDRVHALRKVRLKQIYGQGCRGCLFTPGRKELGHLQMDLFRNVEDLYLHGMRLRPKCGAYIDLVTLRIESIKGDHELDISTFFENLVLCPRLEVLELKDLLIDIPDDTKEEKDESKKNQKSPPDLSLIILNRLRILKLSLICYRAMTRILTRIAAPSIQFITIAGSSNATTEEVDECAPFTLAFIDFLAQHCRRRGAEPGCHATRFYLQGVHFPPPVIYNVIGLLPSVQHLVLQARNPDESLFAAIGAHPSHIRSLSLYGGQTGLVDPLLALAEGRKQKGLGISHLQVSGFGADRDVKRKLRKLVEVLRWM
jgi:hypothetical protein